MLKQARAVRMVPGGVAVVLLGLLAACGGGGGNPMPVTLPPPTPAPPTVVSQGSGPLALDFVAEVTPFTTTVTGTLDATVDWTFATNDVDLFLARGVCTPQLFLASLCNLAASSISTTAKPERLRLTGVPPGTYTLMIGNIGPGDESVAWQVVLTPTVASASSHDEDSQPLPAKARYRGTTRF